MARHAGKIITPAWPDTSFESELWGSGNTFIAGVDEAGRGAWAGPVTAGAVILPKNDPDLADRLSGVRDSKQMTASQRVKWAAIIQQYALATASGWASYEEIDGLGILAATRLAMKRAVEALSIRPEHLLIDALKLPDVPLPQTNIIKGDARSLSIASASIIAKTERDHYMELLEEKIPGYGFARHKGYGTAWHSRALAEKGVSAQHRRSYAPVQAILQSENKE
ncbi:ribonuclease HII [Leptolinea tardivitalis]|uniref:Ribonuclease HII n=1 Tax=Leptolinea tardivitalis TaxID=229920 RepID=A0A0P6XHW3_9CHLR|nr:ribonuclease HII [Leptolinea tardivitalis]KPL75069.1 ribonuclease HII [Leptolinea tardivitalis]